MATDKTKKGLLAANKAIELELFTLYRSLRHRGDHKWFFTRAHAEITRQINGNIDQFLEPEKLLEFNIHFAKAFLNVMKRFVRADDGWVLAFKVCHEGMTNGPYAPIIGDVETCAASMAMVHIKQDIRRALLDLGCLNEKDYQKMEVFIQRGAAAAYAELRGGTAGAIEAWLSSTLLPMEIVWRNEVYTEVCKMRRSDSTFEQTAEKLLP